MKKELSFSEHLLKIQSCEIITNTILKKHNCTINENNYVITHNGEILDWTDYLYENIDEIVLSNNEIIIGILFFGDGTIEFHNKETLEALNIYEYSQDDINLIIEQLKK